MQWQGCAGLAEARQQRPIPPRVKRPNARVSHRPRRPLQVSGSKRLQSRDGSPQVPCDGGVQIIDRATTVECAARTMAPHPTGP